MKRVCWVTDELYPFTAGGIGRLIDHMVTGAVAVEPHLLLLSSIKPAAVRARYGGRVAVHNGAGRWFNLGRFLRQMRFDHVEFPDYLGHAAKVPVGRVGEVVVRVHGADSVIRRLQGEETPFFERERGALLRADRVVAPLAPVADACAAFFGLERARIGVEFPPVLGEGSAAKCKDGAHATGEGLHATGKSLHATGGGLHATGEGLHATGEGLQATGAVSPTSRAISEDIVFATKIQAIKRPDLFVDGVVRFMEAVPSYRGRALFACRGGDLLTRVPPRFADRFGRAASREEAMAGAIVVIPSDYESLCLTAYEAAAMGAALVLNARCPAFGPGTPWDEVAWRFDGTPADLAVALEAAWRGPRRGLPRMTPDPPYWSH